MGRQSPGNFPRVKRRRRNAELCREFSVPWVVGRWRSVPKMKQSPLLKRSKSGTWCGRDGDGVVGRGEQSQRRLAIPQRGVRIRVEP